MKFRFTWWALDLWEDLGEREVGHEAGSGGRLGNAHGHLRDSGNRQDKESQEPGQWSVGSFRLPCLCP